MLAPEVAATPMTPEGDFGVEIVVTIDGVVRTLWLSRTQAGTADIFRTPEDERLGLPVDQVVEEVLAGASLDADLPEIVKSARVDRLELKRTAKGFAFGLEIAVDYGESTLRVWLRLSRATGSWSFGLILRLGDPDDPVEVEVELGSDGFFARLDQSSEPKSFNLGTLGRVLSSELTELMGAAEITPREMALGTHTASGNYLLALQFAGGISLSTLPFVGERLPKGAEFGVSNLGLVWCSAGLAGNQTARDAFLEAFAEVDLIGAEALSSGGMFSAALTVPSEDESFQVGLPLRSPVAKPAAADRTAPAPKSSGAVKWFKVAKNVGPLSLRRIGLKYAEKKVWFLFDASVNAGTVILLVDGLGAGLDPFALLGGGFEPEFTLRGLGLSIEGPAAISGAFLRDRIEDPRGDYDEFSGVAIVRTEALTVSGMGSYADPPWGDPSFFAYAFLDKPIGGPPFFFVTGLALGIAINRNLDLPPIDEVSRFPLVRLARGQAPSPSGSNLPAVRGTVGTGGTGGTGGDADLKALLEAQQALIPYTRPSSGRVVLAVGVRFTTFKILDSFALLVGSFGKPFTLDLLVSSRMEIPALPAGGNRSSVPPIAQIGIDLRGTWIPEDGMLVIEGRITEGSWFLDSACRLSGGAAFASWTSGEHAGDFVMTVGGYHPRFQVPAHYAKVPRLAFRWIRGPIEIKGDGYFAMTPSALMAGGSLSATYIEGDFKAWFRCGADFLVAWEPYRYDASMYVEIGASYDGFLWPISVSVGADLRLWGPDMGGIATVDLAVIEIDVRFGDDRTTPAPIDAAVFRDRFLPAENELLSVGVSKGLIRSATSADGRTPLFVVNPAEFALTIESVIPKPDGEKIGIGPMGYTAPDLGKQDGLTWTISKSNIDEKPRFNESPVKKPVPAALWGPAPTTGRARAPGFAGTGPVIDAAVGYAIEPKAAPKARSSKSYETSRFEHNPDSWEHSLKRGGVLCHAECPKADAHHPDCVVPKMPRRENSVWQPTAAFHSADAEPVEAKDVLQQSKAPVDLLAALTGEVRDFAADGPISTEWLADLQEEPRVVTMGPAS